MKMQEVTQTTKVNKMRLAATELSRNQNQSIAKKQSKRIPKKANARKQQQQKNSGK